MLGGIGGLDGAQNEMSQVWNSIPLSGAGIAAAVREQTGICPRSFARMTKHHDRVGNRSHPRCGRGLLRVGAVGAADLTRVHRSGVFMHPSGMCSSRHADEEWPCKRRRAGGVILGRSGRFYILNVVILRCARALAVFRRPRQSVGEEFGPTLEECSTQLYQIC